MLLYDTDPFIFTIPPLDFKITSSQNSEVVKILDVGEVALVGERNIKKVSFSTFLPAKKSKFFNCFNSTNCIVNKRIDFVEDNKIIVLIAQIVL